MFVACSDSVLTRERRFVEVDMIPVRARKFLRAREQSTGAFVTLSEGKSGEFSSSKYCDWRSSFGLTLSK